MVPVLKTGVGRLTAGSNPALSAKKNRVHLDSIFLASWPGFEPALVLYVSWSDTATGTAVASKGIYDKCNSCIR